MNLQATLSSRSFSMLAFVFCNACCTMPGAKAQVSAPPATEENAPVATSEASASEEPQPRKRRFQLGPEIGFFRLTNARSRARFGNSKLGLGIGLTPLRQPIREGKFGFDLKVFNLSQNGNRAVWAPIGVDFRRAIAPSQRYQPYLGASVNLVPSYIKAPVDNVEGKFRVGVGGSVMTGVNLGTRAFIEARYLLTSDLAGYDLSGASLDLGLRF